MVMDPRYRVEIVFVQLEIARLHVADHGFRFAIAKTTVLFVEILVNLESPVSKLAASRLTRRQIERTSFCSSVIALGFCTDCTIPFNEGYLHRQRQCNVIEYDAHSHRTSQPDVYSRYEAFAQ